MIKSAKDKIEEIREKAKRGRVKGFKHSEATKEKIRAGVSKGKEEKEERAGEEMERDRYCLQVERHLSLEEALEKAVVKYQRCRYYDAQAPAEALFDVTAYYQRGEDRHRYYAMEQKIVGIENTIPAARRLLALVHARYVTIAMVVYERQMIEDGEEEGRWVKVKVVEPDPVVILKEDKEGKSYSVGMQGQPLWW